MANLLLLLFIAFSAPMGMIPPRPLGRMVDFPQFDCFFHLPGPDQSISGGWNDAVSGKPILLRMSFIPMGNALSPGGFRRFSAQFDEFSLALKLRRIAFIATAGSTFTIVTAALVVPMLYNYIHHVQHQIQLEIDFCRNQSAELEHQFVRMDSNKKSPLLAKRWKRQQSTRKDGGMAREGNAAGNGTRSGGNFKVSGIASLSSKRLMGNQRRSPYVRPPSVPPPAYASQYTATPLSSPSSLPLESSSACCSCATGKAGPVGPPGVDGIPGKDGERGEDGRPGDDAAIGALPVQKEFCFDCPAGPMGSPGFSGSPGQPGQPGNPGQPGYSPLPGTAGTPGEQGNPGFPGSPGEAGLAGLPGVLIEVDGQPGPIGPPGLQGVPGLPGNPGLPGIKGPPGPQGLIGDPGKPGKDGYTGREGEQGQTGLQGTQGECNHCPPPRTAPGY